MNLKANKVIFYRILILKLRTRIINQEDKMTKVFPTLLIILDICAAGVYFYANDYRRAVYWFAAAVLTTTVTY